MSTQASHDFLSLHLSFPTSERTTLMSSKRTIYPVGCRRKVEISLSITIFTKLSRPRPTKSTEGRDSISVSLHFCVRAYKTVPSQTYDTIELKLGGNSKNRSGRPYSSNSRHPRTAVRSYAYATISINIGPYLSKRRYNPIETRLKSNFSRDEMTISSRRTV